MIHINSRPLWVIAIYVSRVFRAATYVVITGIDIYAPRSTPVASWSIAEVAVIGVSAIAGDNRADRQRRACSRDRVLPIASMLSRIPGLPASPLSIFCHGLIRIGFLRREGRGVRHSPPHGFRVAFPGHHRITSRKALLAHAFS